MEKKITNRKNKSLSFAGRLQLISSVLASMHTYWASVFILPTRVIHELEQKMRGFLWCQGELRRGKANVSWKSVCVPKYEVGLGIRRIQEMNLALMTKHVWSILKNRNSLWVKWIHTYRLRGRNLWDVPIQGGMSWGWRKLLQIRPLIRPYIWTKVGDGSNTSAWFDKWCVVCPLRDFVTPRTIMQAGLSLDNTLADIVDNGNWIWPIAWRDLFPVLINCVPPTLTYGQPDSVIWSDIHGRQVGFSATNVWDVVRSRKELVAWTKVVWFSKSIPRHSFLLWMVFNNKLKTHDRMKPWEVGGATNINLVCCSLCYTGPDSRSHLFFNCAYSARVWTLVKDKAGLGNVSTLESITNALIPISNGNSARSVIGRLVFAASVYFIWQERNNRMFTSNARSPQQLRDVIYGTVRYKLASIKFKQSPKVVLLLDDWKLPRNILMDGDDPAYVE